jgi:hypothetical protein
LQIPRFHRGADEGIEMRLSGKSDGNGSGVENMVKARQLTVNQKIEV